MLLLLRKDTGELCKLGVGESRVEEDLSGSTSSLGFKEEEDGVKLKVALERRRRSLKKGIIQWNEILGDFKAVQPHGIWTQARLVCGLSAREQRKRVNGYDEENIVEKRSGKERAKERIYLGR